jgi:hypothetical protein
MNDSSRSEDVAASFKQQARRLREFLAAGGHDIKHTHALEAIARIHGYDDFHLLAHAAEQSTSRHWVIATFGGGLLPQLMMAASAADALSAFVAQLARLATEPDVELVVRAQDVGEHRGLYALNNGALVLSMTQPPAVAIHSTEPLPFERIDAMASIAQDLTLAMWERDGWGSFYEKVHDEQFWPRVNRRLEDEALRGASMPDFHRDLPVAELERIMEWALSVNVSVKEGGRHGKGTR